MRSSVFPHVLAVFVSVLILPEPSLAITIEFNRDIRPILAEKCFQCHGPDANARKANLRLDSPNTSEGPFHPRDGLPIMQPGDPEASAIWYRLTTEDEDKVMPPKGSHKQPLTEVQRQLVKRWISEGAEYEDFWAFVAPQAPVVPKTHDSAWCINRIDRFVMTRLEKDGFKPQPRAHKRSLIRRVTFDLTGLPPTREEIRHFLDDGSSNAYEKLVERLMAHPRYGEHMAKYWLDLVRFADTNGIHHDHYREMTPYRDWVIRSFNGNLPFDDFITYQISGDLYKEPTVDQQIASGFNRLHLVIDKGTALPEESFVRNVVDRVTTFGTAFMGLTVGCAVCHDHKYDPVTQKDFYQLFAFFNNIDAGPETPGRNIHAPFLRLPSPEQSERLDAIERNIIRVSARVEYLKKTVEKVDDSTTVDNVSTYDERTATARLKTAEAELAALAESKKQLQDVIPVSLVMKERKEVRPSHILIRGAYDQPGKRVERDTPSFLPPLVSQNSHKTRMDLANWLTDKGHPLTGRVTVNRLWQQFFGIGLVKTSEDFGTQGQWPSHPNLLDELTTQFVSSGWDVKSLVKVMVCSQTYQQSSKMTMAAFQADPENRLLARGSRFRLDAEMIRDQILAASGLLNETLYGKSVKPPQPPNLWKSVSMVSSTTYSFTADTGAKIHRRSLYSFWKRALPPPQMTIFDAPTREACITRRERTNTPLQALVLMNEEQYFKAAKHFARKLLAQEDLSTGERLASAYELITSHLPDELELASLRSGLDSLRAVYQENPASAGEMTDEMENVSDEHRVEVAAYTMLVNSLFNLDITKTRE